MRPSVCGPFAMNAAPACTLLFLTQACHQKAVAVGSTIAASRLSGDLLPGESERKGD